MSRRSPSRVRILLASFGVALVVVFVWRIGPDAILAQLENVGPEAVWLLVPYAAGTALGGLPWLWLLPRDDRPSLGAAVASRFAASGANMMLPFFGLAGEPSRLLWLRPGARATGVAALIVDRILYNLGSHLFLLLGGVVALATADVPLSVGAGAFGVAMCGLGATTGIAWAIVHWGIGRRLESLLGRFRSRSEAPRAFATEVDGATQRLLGAPRRRLASSILLHAAGRVVMGVEVYVALWMLDISTSLANVIVLATVPIATAFVASSVPSQLGVQEGALALVCHALGLTSAVGITLVLLQRLRQLAFAPLAPVLIGMARAPEAPLSRVTTLGLPDE